MAPDGPKWSQEDFFSLIQALPTFWAERILILRIFIFLDFWVPNFQISRPGLGQAWAQLGPGLGRAGVGLGWAWAGLGLGRAGPVSFMFPPLMKKPPMFSVPWILEATFLLLAIR